MTPRPGPGRGGAEILVYDAEGGGHRANYVRLFADMTGGVELIAPIRQSLRRLVGAPNLVLTTIDTAPRVFLPILLLRSLMGRRSAIVSLRSHLLFRRRTLRTLPGRLAVGLLGRLETILAMTLVPFAGAAGKGDFLPIRDPEFWDVEAADLEAAETTLSANVRAHAAGRSIILLIGNLDPSKGLSFLREIFLGDPGLFDAAVPVLCGPVLADGKTDAAALRAAGAFVESRYLERAELMSLFRAADAAWCCYPPERDLSSGIFGRAVQFGIAPIVRRGSVLGALAADVPNAISLLYGEPEAARAALRLRPERVRPAHQFARERDALRTLLLAHFGRAPAAAG